MYILKISNRAFVLFEGEREIKVVQEPSRATTFESIGDAIRAAAEINADWDENLVRVTSYNVDTVDKTYWSSGKLDQNFKGANLDLE